MIKILFIGKTNEQFISAGIDKFLKRINHFYPTKILFLLPVGHTEYLKMLKTGLPMSFRYHL